MSVTSLSCGLSDCPSLKQVRNTAFRLLVCVVEMIDGEINTGGHKKIACSVCSRVLFDW